MDKAKRSADPLSAEILAKIGEATKSIDADVYLLNGGFERGRDLECIDAIAGHRGRKKALLIPVSLGGDPDAAYKITRFLQDSYERFTVLVSGMCKSAGTLVAVGAHELAFTAFGELGPLDVQLSKVDRFDQLESGLTIQDALDTLESRATLSFYKIIQEYIAANNGLMSFATASQAASDFITQLYSPVFARIDPEEVGTRARYMRIAVEYGKRLDVVTSNLTPKALKMLAETYSSHSFVIDQREASSLFQRVRAALPEEERLVSALGNLSRFPRSQSSEFLFRALSTKSGEPRDKHAATISRRGPSPNGKDSSRTNPATHPAPKRSRRSGTQSIPR